MTDNLEPIASALKEQSIRRAHSRPYRPPRRDAFHRIARSHDPRLAQDFDDLYYECHRLFVIETWKHENQNFEIGAEKMERVKAAYSADTYPKLRAVIEHRGCYWFIAAIMHMGDLHPPLAKGHLIRPEGAPAMNEPESDGFYVGSTVTHKGMNYTVTSRTAVFYSHERLDEKATQQKDLFS